MTCTKRLNALPTEKPVHGKGSKFFISSRVLFHQDEDFTYEGACIARGLKIILSPEGESYKFLKSHSLQFFPAASSKFLEHRIEELKTFNYSISSTSTYRERVWNIPNRSLVAHPTACVWKYTRVWRSIKEIWRKYKEIWRKYGENMKKHIWAVRLRKSRTFQRGGGGNLTRTRTWNGPQYQKRKRVSRQ